MHIENTRLRFHPLQTAMITTAISMLLLSSTLIPLSTVYAEAKNQTTVDQLAITLPDKAHSLMVTYSSIANANPPAPCQTNLNGNSHFSFQFSSADHRSFAFGSAIKVHAWTGNKCDGTMLSAQRWMLPKLGDIINSTCVLDMTNPQSHPTGCTNGNSPNGNDTNTVVATLSIKLPREAHSLQVTKYFSRTNPTTPITTSPCQKNLNGSSQFTFEFSPADHHSFASGSQVTLSVWTGQQCDLHKITGSQTWTLPTDGTVASSICDLDTTSHKGSTVGC